jgi:HK97 family phage major capsid protein
MDLSASQPPTLFGKKVYIDPSLPRRRVQAPQRVARRLAAGHVVARYGRPILIRDDVSTKGQVLLYSEQRVGGNMTDSSALKTIKTST